MREFENSEKYPKSGKNVVLITEALKHELARIYEKLRKMRKMLPKTPGKKWIYNFGLRHEVKKNELKQMLDI